MSILRAGNYEAQFTTCFTGRGTNCVVDGDTFWFSGKKIRISDIDAPETDPPNCQREADLGRQATAQLKDLLNAGPWGWRQRRRRVWSKAEDCFA
jgi:micrococcal nuclease